MVDKKNVRTLVGTVVSNKMDRTISVLVERKVKHPLYRKYVKKSTKIMFTNNIILGHFSSLFVHTNYFQLFSCVLEHVFDKKPIQTNHI